jgi:hypothetical protein
MASLLRWMFVKNPNVERLELERENQIRIKKIEQQLQQFWVIQNGLVPQNVEESSIVIVDDK